MREYGFTRETLARSALEWPLQPHTQPLSESAVSTLFGEGDAARRTLIGAWLEEGQIQMRAQPASNVKDALNNRLRYNEPVLPLLPEVSGSIPDSCSAYLMMTITVERRLLCWPRRNTAYLPSTSGQLCVMPRALQTRLVISPRTRRLGCARDNDIASGYQAH